MTTSERAPANPADVVCLFCGTQTPVPAFLPLRRSAGKAGDANFRVSIIRCHKCGKEAPYRLSADPGYDKKAKAAGAD